MPKDQKLYCKQYKQWIIVSFSLKEQIARATKSVITLDKIDDKVKIGEKLDIVTPDVSYRFIVYELSIDYSTNQHILTLLHPIYVLEQSKNINFFQLLTHKAIISSILKQFQIEVKISLPYNYKKELEIQYNESPLEFIKRICSVENSVIVPMPDGSLYIGVYNKPKVSKLSLVYHSPYKNQELLVKTKKNNLYKYQHNIMGYIYDNPNQPFLSKSATVLNQQDHYGDNCENLKQYNKFSNDINQHENSYIFETVSNYYSPLLSQVKTKQGKLYIVAINIQLTYNDREGKISVAYHSTIKDINLKYNKISIPVQRAQVVSKNKEKKGSVSIDKKNRVYVTFYSDYKKQTIPVMVSTLMGAPNGGWLWTPRVSEEVLIHFIDHSSHQPIIIHSLYNKINKLPKKPIINPKYSYGFTIETPQQPIRYNSFWIHTENKKELIEFKGQKDFSTELEEGDYSIKLNSKKQPTKHNTSIIKGDYLLNIDKGNRTITLKDGNNSIILNKGNQTIEVKGNVTIQASKNVDIEGKNININSKDNVKITGKSIDIDAQQIVNITSKLNMNIKSTKLDITIKTILNINAAIFKLITKVMTQLQSKVSTVINAKVLLQLKSSLLLKTDSIISLINAKTLTLCKTLLYLRESKINAIKGFFMSIGVIISGIWSFAIPQPI